MHTDPGKEGKQVVHTDPGKEGKQVVHTDPGKEWKQVVHTASCHTSLIIVYTLILSELDASHAITISPSIMSEAEPRQ